VSVDPMTASGPATGPSTGRDGDLLEACRDLESVFLDYLLREMDRGIMRSGPLSGGFATNIYRDTLYEELSRSLSRAGGIGLADHLYETLARSASVRTSAPTAQEGLPD